jgi:uncharacterized protein HemX
MEAAFLDILAQTPAIAIGLGIFWFFMRQRRKEIEEMHKRHKETINRIIDDHDKQNQAQRDQCKEMMNQIAEEYTRSMEALSNNISALTSQLQSNTRDVQSVLSSINRLS